jgi:hypothetical protein
VWQENLFPPIFSRCSCSALQELATSKAGLGIHVCSSSLDVMKAGPDTKPDTSNLQITRINLVSRLYWKRGKIQGSSILRQPLNCHVQHAEITALTSEMNACTVKAVNSTSPRDGRKSSAVCRDVLFTGTNHRAGHPNLVLKWDNAFYRFGAI